MDTSREGALHTPFGMLRRRKRDRDLAMAYAAGEHHGLSGLPWLAPDGWDTEMQDEYTRGYGVGYAGTSTPMAEAELVLLSGDWWRVTELIARGIVWERENPRPLRAEPRP